MRTWMRGMMLSRLAAWVVIGTAPALAGTAVSVDPALPQYKPTEGVSGSIKSVGSDTMNNLMTLWAEGFCKFYPAVQPEIEGKGSSTAPPALISGAATFGPMSRPIKNKEVDDFEKVFGYKPVQLPVAIDMLAVFVSKDNPVEGLTLAQVDAIFSSTRRVGLAKDIRIWGDLGLGGEWANRPLSLYGRNAASGTYGFFKEHALGNGDFKAAVKEQPGSSSVVVGIANDKGGIGYSGIGYTTADVRAVPLARAEGEPMVPATAEHAFTGEYPLSRFLLLTVNYKPGTQLDPLRREFLRFIFSQQGQAEVVKDGYYPLPAALARQALKQVNIEPGF